MLVSERVGRVGSSTSFLKLQSQVVADLDDHSKARTDWQTDPMYNCQTVLP